MQALMQDLLYGLRLMRSTPGFTAVAVLTLALGIGVNTAVFSWVNGLLLRPVPGVSNASELVFIETVSAGSEPGAHMSWRDYQDYRDQLTLASGVAIGKHTPLTVGPEGKPERVWGEMVSGNYFSLLGVKIAVGRGFLAEEADDRAAPVAVISHGLWHRHFNADSKIVGKLIRINRRQLTVIGVAPPDFRGGTPGLVYDVWIPYPMVPLLGVGGSLTHRATRDGTATFARLRPGATVEQLRQQVRAVAARLAAAAPRTNAGVDATVFPLAAGHNGAQGLLGGPLRILMAGGALVLLIVCANVANLLLARAVTRQHEFGIRMSIGCGRGRLIRQVFTETLLLALAGAGLGVLLSLWFRDSLEAFLPPHDMPVSLSAPLDLTALAFTVAICLLSTLICGIAPALLSGRAGLNEKLKEGGRSDSAGGGRSNQLRKLLIVSEVALASVALICAALFYRSFVNASAIYPGFERKGVLIGRFYLSSAGYSAQDEVRFCRLLRDRLRTAGGVSEVTYADQVPLSFGNHPEHQIEPEAYVPRPGEDMYVQRTLVGSGYFNLLRIPLVEGRDFTDLDTKETEPVLVVNEAFARRYYGGRSPLGRKVRIEGKWRTIVGLVKDAKYDKVTEAPKPYFYTKYDQFFSTGLTTLIYVRTAGNPADLVPALRREVLAIDPDAAAFHAGFLVDETATALLAQTIAAALLTTLALMALMLAAVGLYGVMSYSVSTRTRELGLRMALGASATDILRTVLRGGVMLTLVGTGVGVALALVLTRTVSSMLVNVSASDPLAFFAGVLVLVPVSVVATLIPARRATRLSPTEALRAE